MRKENIRDEQWNSSSVKKEIVEGVIITIYPGARTIPGFKYDYEFKNDLYKNSDDFPDDLWNLSVDSLYAYKAKKIRVELIESNPKNSRVLLMD